MGGNIYGPDCNSVSLGAQIWESNDELADYTRSYEQVRSSIPITIVVIVNESKASRKSAGSALIHSFSLGLSVLMCAIHVLPFHYVEETPNESLRIQWPNVYLGVCT